MSEQAETGVMITTECPKCETIMEISGPASDMALFTGTWYVGVCGKCKIKVYASVRIALNKFQVKGG